jgi:Ca2+-transporting ATPase
MLSFVCYNSSHHKHFPVLQVFNEVNAREMEKLNVFAHTFNNPVFLLVITFTVVFQVILVEFLGKFAGTVPLNVNQWIITVGIGFVSLFVAVIVKFIPVPKPKPANYNSASVVSNGNAA